MSVHEAEIRIIGGCPAPGCPGQHLELIDAGKVFTWCSVCDRYDLVKQDDRPAFQRQTVGDEAPAGNEGSHLLSTVHDVGGPFKATRWFGYPGDKIDTGPGGDL